MTTNELLAHRITQIEARLEQERLEREHMQTKVDKLVIAIMLSALTLGTSAIVFALSVVSLRGGR